MQFKPRVPQDMYIARGRDGRTSVGDHVLIGRRTLIVEQGRTSWGRGTCHAGCVHWRLTREKANADHESHAGHQRAPETTAPVRHPRLTATRLV